MGTTTQRYWRFLPILGVLALMAGLLSAAPVRAAGGSVSPQEGGVGTRFNFSADGFVAGERVDFWVTGPDGSVAPRYPSVEADDSGAVVWSWDVAPGTASGPWNMTARGIESDTRVVIGFSVVGSAPTTLPNSVSPAGGPAGTTFSFSVGGFEPGERVGAWLTTPDGSSRDFVPGEEFRAYADESGAVSWAWQSPATAAPGQWRANARGLESRREVGISFQIIGEAPVTPDRSIVPTSGGPGTTFTVTVAGLNPGEEAGSWLNMPNGDQINATPYLRADGGGVVTWSWTAPADALNGQWQAVTRGKDSGLQVELPFTIGGSDGPAAPPSTSGSASPQSAAPGSTVTFTAGGFDAGEEVGYWPTDPSGKAVPLGTHAVADPSGVASWTWAIPPTAVAGQWTMTGRGEDSLRAVYIPFTVLEGAPVPGTFVTPESGGPGTTFTFVATGFRTKPEEVFFWFVDPNGKNVDGPNSKENDPGGGISWQWTAPQDVIPGRWLAVAHGERTGFEQVIPFTITSAGSAVPSASVSPESGGPGTTFTFTASGYKESERVGYWLNLPDGTVLRFDRELGADRNGVVTWTWTAPADAQRGLYVMAARSSQNDRVDNDVSHEIRFTVQ